MPVWYRVSLVGCYIAGALLLYTFGQQAAALDAWDSYPIAVAAIFLWLILMTWIGQEISP